MKEVKVLHSTGHHDVSWANVKIRETKEELHENEILVKTAYTGICRSDIDMYYGSFGPLPVGMYGHEGIGTVIEIGKGLKDFTTINVGDFVATCCDGGFSEYHNATKYIKVPELHPKFILEPVACAFNIIASASILERVFKNQNILTF